MPEDHGAGLLTVVHLVELGVADAAGQELDGGLVRLGIGDFQLVDEEGLIDADLDGCPASHFFSWEVSFGRTQSAQGILRSVREPVNIAGVWVAVQYW